MNIKHFSLGLTVSLLLLSVPPMVGAESAGSWACKLGGEEWTAKGGATLNGGNLTLYSEDERVDGIYIMTSKPAKVGNYGLNESAQASFTDTAGTKYRAKAGSGAVVISQYLPPENSQHGRVEGTFSADFESDGSKGPQLKDCKFSLPVKNL